MHAFFSCFSRFHTESIHFYAPHPSPRPHATIAYQALRPDIKMAFAKSIATMPMFTRSRSRGDRDRDPTSKKWLSGISVGNWSLGLSFEDEEEELVNTSNAVMIDRSEPAISWKAQVLLAKSKFEAGDNLVTSKEEEEEEKEERGNSDNGNLVSSLSKDSSRPEVTVKDFEVKEPISSKSTVSDCLLARNSGEASELLSDGLQSAISTAANTGAAENGQADLMTDHQDREFSINGIDSPAKFSDRCVAVAGGRPGGSKGPLKAGITAKASQGFEGGSPRSPIGMPLNTPTQLSYTRNKDKAGSEGDEGDETMSFFNSHTTTGQSDPKKGSPVQKKHGGGGGDSATHAAVFSSSKCKTDNGSSFSKDIGTSTCTWSLAAVDCGSSISSSRTGLDVCMNDTASTSPLGERINWSASGNDSDGTDKNTRTPSPCFSQSDLVSSYSKSGKISTSSFLEDAEENSEEVGNNFKKNNIKKDNCRRIRIFPSATDTTTSTIATTIPAPTASWKTFPPITASHTDNNGSLPVNNSQVVNVGGSRGVGITRLHYNYSSPYQQSPKSSKSGLTQSPGQTQAVDLIRNTEQDTLGASPTSPNPQPQPRHQNHHHHHHQQLQLQSQSSSGSLPSVTPSTPTPTYTKRNPPFLSTVLTTPSATPFPAIPTSPTGHGASHKVGSVLLLDSTSPALSTAASPIEICATARESLQPQVQVPVPKEYHPQGPTSVSGPVSLQSASEGVNEVVRPVTASSSSTSLSAGSLGSFNTHLSSITPTTQSGNLSSSSISTSTSPGIFTMAARSAAAQKSLKRSGAARDQYAPFASKHTSYASPPPLMDTAPSSSNSSQEFQIQNDIHTLQTAARQREQAEVGHRGRGRARADSGSRMQGSYVKGHGKSGSGGNEILENVFGIYPEKKSMGTGVSVADVVASKLFKWGSKKEAPSTIPTPSREKVTLQRSQRHPHHPSMFVGGVPQQVARPPSSHQDRDQDYHPSQRDDMLHSRASNLDQAKLDELMTRQKLLEDRINQLKMERDQLMEANNQPPPQPQPLPLKPHHEAAQPPRHISYVPTTVQPLRIPSNPPARVPDLRHSHSMSSAVHARQMAEPLDLPIQFPLPPQQPQSQYLQPLNSTSPGRGRSARAFPSSKHIQPLKTTPMAIPSAIRQDPAATSIHYASRPLPQPPIDATPPPEYEPPEQSYGRQYRDMKVKIASPNSGMVITQEVILEEPIPNPDDEKYPGSPRDDIDAEDILGWFETLKFASTGPRGRGPMAPLPRPEAGEIKITPRGGEKSPAPESATTGYFDVKLPIHTQKQHATFDVGGTRKDWNTGRKKRSEPKLRDYREDMRLAAV
ncbi:hypothetical protein TWF225_009882 [Orbilia oligospora]|nr:hypothetical protein TWF225_009882 [Orbilia oligospora]KAF3266362.1 hypothetical protein TWF128_010777 [Orbilia oligospora]KAF3269270.1 hypothetical protein TWF217_009361 [Orbilia oligospora]KAF3291659.1 hypothetical protein TWF132_006647 [Orbilia oligospora]